MKLGLMTAAFPNSSLTEIAQWAGNNGTSSGPSPAPVSSDGELRKHSYEPFVGRVIPR